MFWGRCDRPQVARNPRNERKVRYLRSKLRVSCASILAGTSENTLVDRSSRGAGRVERPAAVSGYCPSSSQLRSRPRRRTPLSAVFTSHDEGYELRAHPTQSSQGGRRHARVLFSTRADHARCGLSNVAEEVTRRRSSRISIRTIFLAASCGCVRYSRRDPSNPETHHGTLVEYIVDMPPRTETDG